MNREIKFRGLRYFNLGLQEHEHWAYGLLVAIDITDVNGEVYSQIETNLKKQNTFGVKTETIGQFTGVKDKNGKEIYEGDKIKFLYYNKYLIKTVVFDREYNRFCVFKNGVESMGVNQYLSNDIEVIGNIHDNKELVE